MIVINEKGQQKEKKKEIANPMFPESKVSLLLFKVQMTFSEIGLELDDPQNPSKEKACLMEKINYCEDRVKVLKDR